MKFYEFITYEDLWNELKRKVEEIERLSKKIKELEERLKKYESIKEDKNGK